MKHFWLSILAVCILGLPAAIADEAAYHVSAFLFDTQEIYKPGGECEGNADVCKYLFMPPVAYDGRYIPIPKSATVYGVIAVTDGKTCKIIPLFRWSDDKGKTCCGCNGPTPWYARQEDSEEKLLKSILDAIKKT